MVLPRRRGLALIIAIPVLSVIAGVQAFPGGSPFSTCQTRYPVHDNIPARTTQGPYSVTLNQSNYEQGDFIRVTILSKDGKQFSGFQIAAYRKTCPSEIVGEFTAMSNPEKSLSFSCVGGVHNMVTHRNGHNVPSIEFVWTARSNTSGDITFKATVLEDYGTYWTNVEATLPAKTAVSDKCSYQEIYPWPLTKATDFSGCMDTKACFLYPRTCHGDDCVAAVSFEYRAKTNDYQVEMYADPGPTQDYVGVAFSTDDDMGDDETIVCTAESHVMSLQYGYNPGKENERLRNGYLFKEAEVKNEDGRIQCRFVMPHNSTVITIVPSTAASNHPITRTRTFDKSNAWRIQLAWGPVIRDSDVITMHIDMPATTTSSVVIKEPGIYRGTAYNALVKFHACFMIIAWTFLSGIVTVIARHYREVMPRRRLLGSKVWFQLHRGLAILIATMTGIAVIVIFSVRGLIKKAAAPHAACGLIVVISLGIQIITAMRRPDPGNKRRLLFNWGHRVLGQATHLFAGITMFLAFKIDYVTESMRTFGYITLGVWLGVQLIWHLAFEVASYFFMRSESASDPYLMDEIRTENKSWLPPVMMLAYVLCLAPCCISVMCAFLLY